MRFGLWGLGALILGAVAAHFILADRGYVLVSFRGYVVEMSVPILIVAVGLVYFAARALVTVFRAPRRLGDALGARRMRRSGRKLTRGLVHLTEGDFARGERLLTQGIKGTDAPLVNYLLAARAAQRQGQDERRNEWLKLAYEELPEAETAILLTQAELQLEDGEHEQAVATLRRLAESHPHHPVALGLLIRSYRALGARRELAALLPQLARARLPEDLREEITAEVLDDVLRNDEPDLETLKKHWSALSAPLRQSPRLLAVRARWLDRLGAGDEAERELKAALKRQWDTALVRAYGELTSGDARKRLKQAESWLLAHPEDGPLLIAAARLCITNELWGKARSYLESSLAIAPDARAYAIYGQLLGRLGERENAADAYRSGLALASGGHLELPALRAPIEPPGEAREAFAGDEEAAGDDEGGAEDDTQGGAVVR